MEELDPSECAACTPAPPCGCGSVSVTCPTVPSVSASVCPYTIVKDTCPPWNADNQANLDSEYAAAQSSQRVEREAIPDVRKKFNEVENGNKKSSSQQKENLSGHRLKTFTITGSINIDECQSGGLCQASASAEASTGTNTIESLSRVADSDAEVHAVASKSVDPEFSCGCA